MPTSTASIWQDGPRGEEKVFAAGMLMIAAERSIGDAGTLQLRAMLSPDPLMGKRGYPLLLSPRAKPPTALTRSSTASIRTTSSWKPSASYAHRLSSTNSVFVYAGLPGEPAFGPPAFMHRPAAIVSPSSHHPPLARLDPHHLRCPHRRLGA